MEPDPVFQKALENFKKDLTVQQRRDFGIATLKDVKDEVNKIQIQHGSAKKLRGMSRMSKFLEAMQQLEQVISVFLNVSEVVAFIWGPIKFFLVVASSRLEILECLLDTFTDISEVMPDVQGYVSIFKDQPEVLEVLKRCYGDIIQFYHMAFGVLGRPAAFGMRDLRTFFDSVWKTFRTKSSPILNSLRRHRELLEQVKSTATFGEVQRTRLALQETIEKSNEELKQILWGIHQKKKQILEKLGSQDSYNDRGHRRLPDQRYPTSGDWILKERIFLQWLDPDELSKDLLYLNGMPGAGKTTLTSRIIDSMTRDETTLNRPLLNFYFEHGQSGKTRMMDMLRSFIEQLLQQDDAIVDNLHETVLPARPSDLGNLSWLEDIATRIILAQKNCYIVVDGLDECTLEQRKHILEWLKTILSTSKASKAVVKTLVSGQRDGVIDVMLQGCACTIKLDNQTPHLRDIERFSSSVLTQLKNRFPGLEDEEEILKRLDPSRIAEASTGMFMYAKVVLENFLSQTSIYELEQEVEREYPSGLDEAYDRVAERVLEKTSVSQKQAALQILGLITCAARPLKWREIQCYFCIDAVSGTCDPRRRKSGEPKDLCSSFVESKACKLFPNMKSEAQLTMVHNTAKSYLLRSGRLDLAQQHMHMSLFCFQYLTSSAFDMMSRGSKTVGTAGLTGVYGLFDYAAAHWDHHSLQFVRQASLSKSTPLTEEFLRKTLSMAWKGFVKKFSVGHGTLPEARSDSEVPLETSQSQFIAPDAVDTESDSYNIQEIFSDWNSTRRSSEFESLAVSLRLTMQQTDLRTLEDREKAVYFSLNGPLRPKCSRRACVHFNTGFESEAELALHSQWHEMAFKCPHAGCYAWLAGFPTSALLQTHLRRVHPVIDSEERLFPIKTRNNHWNETRSQSQTLEEACRLGDIELVRSFPIPTSTEADLLAANKLLLTVARERHLAICVYLTQLGANPYFVEDSYGNGDGVYNSAIRHSILSGDLDLFSALRGAARQHHEIAFIEAPLALLECILDALVSSNPQILAGVLAWNGRRTVPFTLDKILLRTCVKTQRREYEYFWRPSTRPVIIEQPNFEERFQILISSELERHKKFGQPPELCHEQVLIAPDVRGWSNLHRLCGGDQQHTSVEAVRFLLAKLRSEDIWRQDSEGNPPLFIAMENKFRLEETALKDQVNIIRSFFGHDSDAAKNTRNAAGHGPLEFAFRHGTPETFPLVFELCGTDYSVMQLCNVFAQPADRGLHKISLAVGIDRVDERIRMAARLTSGQMHHFIYLLDHLNSEPEIAKMLQSLVHHLPPTKSSEPVNGISRRALRYILASPDPRSIRFLFSLKGTNRIVERCLQQLDVVAPARLRKMLFVSLEVQNTQCGVARILLTQRELGLEDTGPEELRPVIEELAARRDMDPEIVSLLKRRGWCWDLSSIEARDRIIQTLGHNIYASEQSEGQYPSELRRYVDSLVQYADSEGYQDFAASLHYLRQCFR